MRDGWEIRKLGDLAELQRGLTYSKGDEVLFSSKCVLRSNNIDLESATLDLTELKYLRDDFTIPEDRKVKKDSIFICMSNGSKQHVGKVAFIDTEIDYAFGGFMGLIVPRSGIVPKYVFYSCQSSAYRLFLSSIGNGIGITNLRFTDLANYSIPVPPIQEQEKIVAELDCLTGIIEKKRQQMKELDKLAQSIFYDMFGSISNRVTLSHYADSFYGGKSLAGDEECPNTVLKSGAVTYDYFRGEDVKYLPTDYCPREEDRVRAGDLLISRMNTAELVGACAFVWGVNDNVFLPDRLWRVNLKDNANPVFIWKAMIQPQAKEQIRGLASGTSGTMKNISKPKLMSVTIPLVGISLQNHFAQKIESIQKQKELIKKSIADTEKLFNSRMDYWFN